MFDLILGIVLSLIMVICLFAIAVKEYKNHVNSMPNGKNFVKNFVSKIDTIQRVTDNSNSITVTVKGRGFNVSAKKDDNPKGLEYETIPVYRSTCIYIDDEPVCRMHNLHLSFKDNYYLEFSSKRRCKEVIEITEEAFKIADQIRDEQIKTYVGSYLSTKSFYDN